MKRNSKLLCAMLSVLLILSVCGSLLTSAEAFSYSFTEKADKTYSVTDGVLYREFDLTSGIVGSSGNGFTVSASALEFGLENYTVLAYSGVAGGSATLDQHYQIATDAGYEVVAIINGSFFSMDYKDGIPNGTNGNCGYLNEYLVSNGVIYSGDNDNAATDYDGMLCIGSDGTLTAVSASMLHYNLYFNGTEVPSGLGYINKTAGCNNAANWGNQFYYFDCHSGDLLDETSLSKALTYEVCPGYEILCRKLNHTDLTIGGTLEAEVLSVRENAYGGTIGADEFILFVKADSPLASQAAALEAGDSVSISAFETVSEASAATSSSASIIANVGFLVKDGKDLTSSDSFNLNAAHSNTQMARWTAFGTKEDGSWVFFTTEGASTGANGSVTLQDVAQAMIELGCTTVIRMDGGGSSAMYVCDDGSGNPGFLQASSREVADCIMLVKKSSPALQTSDERKQEVQDLIEQAEVKKTDSYVANALAYAVNVTERTDAVSGDYLLAYMKLRYALSGKNALGDLMSEVAGITFSDYSEYVLSNLRTAYQNASSVFGNANATAAEVEAAYAELRTWYMLSGDVEIDGKTYSTVDTGIYLTGLNLSILTNYCSIYTPGTNVSGVNLNWSQVTLLRYSTDAEAFLIEDNFFGAGNPTMILSRLGFEVVPDDCLVIGTHGDTGTAGESNRTLAAKGTKGQMLVLYGIDLESNTTGVGAYFAFEKVPAKYPKGDIDGNGVLDAKDYMKLKRHVLSTYTLTEDEASRADVDNSGKIDARDYMMVKRAFLGTYEFPTD